MKKTIAVIIFCCITLAITTYVYKVGEANGYELAHSGFDRGYDTGFGVGKIFGSSTCEVEVCEHSVIKGVRFLTPAHIVCEPTAIVYDCFIPVPLKSDYAIDMGNLEIGGALQIYGALHLNDDSGCQTLVSYCTFISRYEPDIQVPNRW